MLLFGTSGLRSKQREWGNKTVEVIYLQPLSRSRKVDLFGRQDIESLILRHAA